MVQNFSKCDFPDCQGKYNPQRTGNITLCVRHAEMMKFFLWMLDNVKLNEKQEESKSGLILP